MDEPVVIHENRKFNFIVSEFLMGNSGPENGFKITSIFVKILYQKFSGRFGRR